MIKKVSTILLLIVAIAGVAAALYRRPADSAAAPVAAQAEPVAAATAEPVSESRAGPLVTVTYFTTSVRCASCMRIEEWTRKAVDSRFADEVAAGRVSFRMVYTDTPANEHYIQDYQLVSKSVVVAESLEGREQEWVNLQDVWLLLHDEQAFADYIAGAVAAHL